MEIIVADLHEQLGLPYLCPTCGARDWYFRGELPDEVTTVWCAVCDYTWQSGTTRDYVVQMLGDLEIAIATKSNKTTVKRLWQRTLAAYRAYRRDPDAPTMVTKRLGALPEDRDAVPF